MRLLKNVIISMRPEQWTKNLIVFAALFFGRSLTSIDVIAQTTCIFIIFCAVSSGSYMINDVVDRNEDRHHPEKSKRPIPAGKISIPFAILVSLILIFGGLYASWVISIRLFAVTFIFITLHIAYDFFLKHISILDVFSIAFAFIIRLFAGVTLCSIPVSSWILLCTFLLALFLALCKRRAEMAMLMDGSKRHRKSLEGYSVQFLDQLISIVGGCTIISYSLYSLSPETVANHGTDKLIYTIPFVVYGLFRYLYLVQMKQGGTNPEKLLLRDVPLLVSIILYLLVMYAVVYKIFI